MAAALATTDYGRDIRCTTSVLTGRFATRALLIGEAAYRRLTTPRGMLRDAPDYGFDVAAYVGSVLVKTAQAALPGRIQLELTKDERIQSVDVELLAVTDGPATSFTITVRAETSEGPFTLKLLASAVTVQLLGIT